MTNKQARKVVSDILKIADYDVWKSYFHPPSFERDKEEIDEDIYKMIEVITKAQENGKS